MRKIGAYYVGNLEENQFDELLKELKAMIYKPKNLQLKSFFYMVSKARNT